jgi:SSS family solute:Na+ symporter
MGFVFVICVVFMYIISMYENRNGVITDGLEIDKSMFRPTAAFTVGALIVIGFVVAMYGIYW